MKHGAFAPFSGLISTLAIVCVVVPPLPVHAQESEQSPLAAADAPPAGVAPQLAFFGLGAGGDDCTVSPLNGGGTSPGDSACIWEAGERKQIVFSDFASDADLYVQILWPNGKVESGDIGHERSIGWDSLPGEPLGDYIVEAAQFGRIGFGQFTVLPASKPRYIYSPESGSPGAVFQIGLTGFQPRQQVLLHLYRSLFLDQGGVGGNHVYVTTLGPIQTDARGEATYAVRTSPADRPGYYIVNTEPAAESPVVLHEGFNLNLPPGAPKPTLDTQRATLAQSVVEEADRLWAAVVSDNAKPLTDLDQLFGGDALQQVRADIEALRASGQHIQPCLTGAVKVLSTIGAASTFDPTIPGSHVEALVEERWSGAPPNDLHYVLEQNEDNNHFWRVTEVTVQPAAQ